MFSEDMFAEDYNSPSGGQGLIQKQVRLQVTGSVCVCVCVCVCICVYMGECVFLSVSTEGSR